MKCPSEPHLIVVSSDEVSHQGALTAHDADTARAGWGAVVHLVARLATNVQYGVSACGQRGTDLEHSPDDPYCERWPECGMGSMVGFRAMDAEAVVMFQH